MKSVFLWSSSLCPRFKIPFGVILIALVIDVIDSIFLFFYDKIGRVVVDVKTCMI